MGKRYDAIVIGTGPAGLSAAITLKIRNKSVLVIGSEDVSKKVAKAHEIQNYLGLPGVPGEDLAQKFLDHARQMDIEIVNDPVFMVYAMGDYFSVASKSNVYYEGSTIILALGVSFGKAYAGEETYLGRGVSYCATCDAPLYRGKTVAVIATTPKEEAEAAFLAEVAEKVIYIPTYKEEVRLPEAVEVLRDVPVEIKGGFKADTLVLKNQEVKADGIFILRQSVAPAQLVPGLQMDGRHIAVDRNMRTNLPGCFACGDIVGTPYQYIKAAGEGNVAALSAVEYLQNQKG